MSVLAFGGRNVVVRECHNLIRNCEVVKTTGVENGPGYDSRDGGHGDKYLNDP